jgi:hypothetical protein
MLAVVGTIPDSNFPLVTEEVTLEGSFIKIRDNLVAVNRGTAALLAAAIKTFEVLNQPLPFGYLVGDIGLGQGSRRLYKLLTQELPLRDFHTIAFHYMLPYVNRQNEVLLAVEKMAHRPVLIADAGYMYVAKMSGQASKYDLFTPDIGELAFLADEEAPHPIYTRGFILHKEDKVPELISRAYANNNAARYLLVKGRTDYIANREDILATIDSPMVDTMEPIGGTGDILTGIVAALIDSGIDISQAAITAAKVNRLAGYYAMPTPATQVIEIIEQIPRALADIMKT